MADAFGSLPLPAAAPATGEAAGDPALTKLGAFLQAALNRALALPWASVCPGRSVVAHIFCYDPQTLFDEGRLPALYLWRSRWSDKQFTDDTLRRESTITIWWMTEPGSDDQMAAREPMLNAADATIAAALRAGRDPAWVVTGDTDALAATFGSSLRTWAGLTVMELGNSMPLGRSAFFTDADGREVAAPGLATSVVVSEDLVRDVSIGREATAMHTDYAILDPAGVEDFETGEDTQPPESP